MPFPACSLLSAVEKLAAKKNVTPGQLALAWCAQAHGDDIILPIPGTKSQTRLDENWASRDIVLSDEELSDLREVINRVPIVGDQYAPAFQAMIDRS